MLITPTATTKKSHPARPRQAPLRLGWHIKLRRFFSDRRNSPGVRRNIGSAAPGFPFHWLCRDTQPDLRVLRLSAKPRPRLQIRVVKGKMSRIENIFISKQKNKAGRGFSCLVNLYCSLFRSNNPPTAVLAIFTLHRGNTP